MIQIFHYGKKGEKRDYRIKSTFLLLAFFAVLYLIISYSAPMDIQLDSSFVLTHVKYLSSPKSSETLSKEMQGEVKTQRAKPGYNCPSPGRRSNTEDLLCQNPPTYLPNFKNPCFYDKSGDKPYLRCLPYFHIFGVCKTGTTDLFTRLVKHPQVIPNKEFLGKETWYWTWKRYGKNRQEKMPFTSYLDVFDSDKISDMKVSNQDHSLYSDIITGSGDPMDFWDHTQWKLIPQNNISQSEPDYTAPNLIKHMIPDIKLIVMLREPIERLYSHYYHGSFGNDRESFHRDVISALETVKKCRQSFTLRSCLYNQTIMNQLNVPIYASMYHVHMKTWMDVFPKEQIHIIRTEDFSKDLPGHMTDVFKFLDISDVSQNLLQNITATRHERETQQKKSAGPMFPETRKILKAFFDKENRELVKLLNDTKFNWEDIFQTNKN
ncbi:hypothetical protein FSP39_002955 [Pinctada imbricata]|uniref:Sulfotransferase domain-containing protein n=1 Tax=Pinctada imbricata TaxID=66713 RepID=A0AA88Y1S9_PINIB|nr:hypothetical protein FSP39_002955 [Pinctada imbricata]